MRIKLSKASIVFAVLAILVGMPLLLAPHRIRPSIWERIKDGMTEQEVEELLGAKAENYDGYVSRLRLSVVWRGGQEPPSQRWSSRHGAARVWFNEGRVCFINTGPSDPDAWWARLWARFAKLPEDEFSRFRF
jgi:hypothetical protein